MNKAYAFIPFFLMPFGCPKRPTPVVKNYYNCCSYSLQADAKEGCKVAQKYPNNTIVDENGDRHIFIWEGCEAGKERWREWD